MPGVNASRSVSSACAAAAVPAHTPELTNRYGVGDGGYSSVQKSRPNGSSESGQHPSSAWKSTPDGGTERELNLCRGNGGQGERREREGAPGLSGQRK
eukprot:scaffold13929_cov97-Isochrysis_galbana.AAC.2